jgi:hypothetical protein
LRAYEAGVEHGRAGRNCPMTIEELRAVISAMSIPQTGETDQ